VPMVDNNIDAHAASVAALAVGSPPNGFYLSTAGFRVTQPDPGRDSIRVDFEHDFSIHVNAL
jgi:hypothetical protein